MGNVIVLTKHILTDFIVFSKLKYSLNFKEIWYNLSSIHVYHFCLEFVSRAPEKKLLCIVTFSKAADKNDTHIYYYLFNLMFLYWLPIISWWIGHWSSLCNNIMFIKKFSFVSKYFSVTSSWKFLKQWSNKKPPVLFP